MKTIVYLVVWQNQHRSIEEKVTVQARDITSGARKALDRALRHRGDQEFCSISFYEVSRA